MSEDENPGVRLVGLDGRRRYDPAWKARLVAPCLLPKVSVSRVALDHGLNANLLRKWIKAFKAAAAASSPLSAFNPVQVTAGEHSAVGALEMPAMRGDERPLVGGRGDI